MVFGLFGKGRKKALAQPPEGTVVYAVGDIHGCFRLLVRLQEQIEEDMARRDASRRVVVYLGDYVDRGPNSRTVLEHLLTQPLADCESVHLAGNHDRWMLKFLDDASVGSPWLRNGGTETLVSYGVVPPRTLGEAEFASLQQAFNEALPDTHRAFLQSMPVSHEEGDFFFAHAGVKPGVALAEQVENDLTWIREEFLYSNDDFGKVVVHGHTPTHSPEEYPNRIGVDTGAFMSGKLTAAILHRGKTSFMHS